MPAPLICTNNTQGHVDYGIPITILKSNDYRTSTGTYHRFIPNKGQDFDARIPVKLLKDWKKSDWDIKAVNYNTNYNSEYYAKLPGGDGSDAAPNPLPLQDTHYFRTEKEKYFKETAPPIQPKLSEMKDNYLVNYATHEENLVRPPEPYAKCLIKALGRDEQPPIRIDVKGYYRWLDPYLTTNRSTYINFSDDDRRGIGEKNILTFYVGKGYNPVNAPPTEPLVVKRREPVCDRIPFKTRLLSRTVHIPTKMIPNYGMQSEYQDSYIKQSFSDLYPYLFQSGEEFKDSLPEASPWQNLVAPGMYCTEYCHIGTGWPVESTVDVEVHRKEIVHDRCFTKFCDWSQ